MKNSRPATIQRIFLSRTAVRGAALGVIAAVLLAACFSPLQDQGEAAGIAVSLDFLGALDGSELGWVADIYLYSAGELERVLDGDNNYIARPRANAVPIPVGGESFLRQAFGSVDGVTPESGGGTATRIRVSSVPAGGPYVLFVRIWDDLSSGTPIAEYFTGGWIPGAPPALSINSFFVSAGATTTVPPGGFAEVTGPASTLFIVSGPGFGGAPITTFAEVIDISASVPGGGEVLISVERDGNPVITDAAPGVLSLPLESGTQVFTVIASVVGGGDLDPREGEPITRLAADMSPFVESSTSVTTNTRPEWTWNAIPELGLTSFRYSFDELNWTGTVATSFVPAADLPSGTYELFVQQADDIGEWSASGSFEVTIEPAGSVEVTITLEDPVNPTFTVPSPGTIPRGDLFTVTLNSSIPFDEVVWLVNGVETPGDAFTPPSTTTALSGYDTSGLPLGINRIAVLVRIGGDWYSSQDMTFEVVQP